MIRRFLLGLLLFYSCYASAIPTIAVPDLVFESTPTTLTIEVNNQRLVKSIANLLPKFSADIRGALILSGEFKVINLHGLNESSTVIESGRNLNNATDYYLVGTINYIGENEDSYPIKQTNNVTKQYLVEVSGEFELIRSTDQAIMAAFNASGSGRDIKIISTQNLKNSVWHHDIGKITSNAAKNLAANVLKQMQIQFKSTLDNEEKARKLTESVVVTDVKVYN